MSRGWKVYKSERPQIQSYDEEDERVIAEKVDESTHRELIRSCIEKLKERISAHSIDGRDERSEVAKSAYYLLAGEVSHVEKEIIKLLDRRRRYLESILEGTPFFEFK